jgi:hypothetical protein
MTTLITEEEHFVLQRFQNELKFHCEELPLESIVHVLLSSLAFVSSTVAYPFFWICTYEIILNHDKVGPELFYRLGKPFN